MQIILLLVAGLGVLTIGAEVLIRGAVRIATLAGLSPLVVGLTVVAFGTSTPEVAVSVKASLADQADIAVGNVVGSNIFNVLFILGISAIIAPLTVSRQLVRFDVPVMIAVSGLGWLLSMNGLISRAEGASLVVGVILYTAILIYFGRKESRKLSAEAKAEAAEAVEEVVSPGRFHPRGAVSSILFVIAGLGMLMLGGQWLVRGATELARAWGVSELMIGLTIVAAGTSLPEVATSIMATIKGQRDLAVGNVVGSNIFNILAILGLSSVIADGVPVSAAALQFDIPIMFAIAVACLPIFFTGGRISRWEGIVFLAYYVAYIAYLAMADAEHAAITGFNKTMLWFVFPGTVLGLGLSVVYAVRRRTRTIPQ